MTSALYFPRIVTASDSKTSSPSRSTPTSDQTEGEIIRLAQSGSKEAFEHLYRLHVRRVYRLCLRMTRDAHLAEDLTQEAFLQVFRKILSFRGDSSFATWLHRIAVNIVLMKRRVKRFNETPLEGASEGEGDSRGVKQVGRPDRHVAGVVNRLALKKALTQLPLGYKQVFLLHDVLGYRHDEIAKTLGCSDGTSKSQLHKARTRLRRILRVKHRLSRHLKPIAAKN